VLQKAVLNPHNAKEYVLVYDSGPVYYSFHKDFVEPFKAVIKEWSTGMERCGKYPVHDVIYPFEGLHDNDHDSGIDVAHNNAISDDLGGNQTDQQSVRAGKRPENQQMPSGPQQQLPKGTHSGQPHDVTRNSSKIVGEAPPNQSRSGQGNGGHGKPHDATRNPSKIVEEPPSQSRSGQGNRGHGRLRSLGDEVISFFRV
jgi:hypothetical protein